jgi:hypothetical protein
MRDKYMDLHRFKNSLNYLLEEYDDLIKGQQDYQKQIEELKDLKKIDYVEIVTIDKNSNKPNPIVDIVYRENKDKYLHLTNDHKAVDQFHNDNLFTRLRKAFKGKL